MTPPNHSPTAAVPAAAVAARTRRRPLSRRWAFWFLLALVVCLAYLGGRRYFHHRQVAGQLQTSLEALDRDEPGWRLAELEAARPTLADRDNAARRVTDAHALLLGKQVYIGLYNRLRQLRPNERPADDDVAKVRAELTVQQRALDKARALADLPNGRFAVAYQRNVFLTPLPHCQQARDIATLLAADALVRADDGDPKEALRSCRAALNAGRSLGDEPFASSQLFRGGCVHEACTAVERVLAQGEPEEDDLRDLQQLLVAEEQYPRLLVMMRGERALLNELLDAVEAGDVSLDDLATLTETEAGERYTPLDSVDAVRAEHPEVVAKLTEAVSIARLPAHQRPERVRAFEAALKNGPQRSRLFARLAHLHGLDEGARRADARLRCLVAAVAVERYRRRHHAWPEALDALVPDLLAAVPPDPADGEPLGYRRYPDRVVVWSRLGVPTGPSVPPGPDRAFNADEPPEVGVGVAVHLFDVQHRRTPAAPANHNPH